MGYKVVNSPHKNRSPLWLAHFHYPPPPFPPTPPQPFLKMVTLKTYPFLIGIATMTGQLIQFPTTPSPTRQTSPRLFSLYL